MAATSPHTVMLSERMHYIVSEGVLAAANTPTPGDLLDWSSGELIIHGTAADAAIVPIWCIENDRIGQDLNTAYVAARTCYFVYAQAGAVIYAWLNNGENVAKGAPLEADGAGALQARSTGTTICVADEAVNNSGGGSGPNSTARIRVRVA